MPNREKVVRALENCTARDKCLDCPWESCEYDSPTLRIPLDLAQEALELLKAQEPRMMTLEEVNALDWDYCYLEEERLPGKTYRGMLGKYIMTCVTWPSITAAKISHTVDNYGKTWRCWTSRPTDEQREAIPWE